MKVPRTPFFTLTCPQLLATVTLVTSASAVQVGYQYYRFTPTKLRTDATTGGVQLSEFDFLLSNAAISRTGVLVTNPGGNSSAAESADKLIDGNTATKWLDSNKGQVVFNFNTTTSIDGYRFTTANDANDRDPIRWIFEGSADGTTWVLLDHQTSDFATPTTRLTTTSDILLPASPAPYLFTWNGSISNDWNTTSGNWDAGLWNNGQLLHARFTNPAPATISLTEPITVRKIEATGDSCTLQGSAFSFSSIRGTGAGATTISNNAPLSIASAITGTGGWAKTGSGNLTLSGANTYAAPTHILGGSVTYATGGSYNPASNSNLRIGGSAGRGVLNLDSAGIFKFGSTRLGGDDVATHTGKGALHQTAGEVTHSASYLELGVGVGASGALTDTYGAFSISGGKFTNTGGTRIGCGGYGSFHQAGGEYNAGNWFAIGASTGAVSFGTGVATFTGGTSNVAGNARILLCDRENNTGTLNIGTLAGGNAAVTTNNTVGPSSSSVVLLANTKGLSATLNLNSGTLRFNGGGIARNGTEAGKSAVVNLNGGTLQSNSATSRDLIVANAALSVNVYNGGLKVDTQGNPASISANLVATTGKGIYPAGGVIAVPADGGSGYLGSPLVTVTTTSGSGTGATAIANVSGGVVTGVTLTCPGQGYVAGDTVTFSFTSGGATTPATAYVHTLTVADLADNGAGGLTKLGTGTLTLSGTNTFTGPVTIDGALETTGALTLNNTTLTINGFAPNLAAPLQASFGSLSTSGIVPVVVNGTFETGQFPLIWYPAGGIGGSGISALQLQTGSLPRGVTASLVDNTTNASVDLLITASPLTWKGNTSAVWDINTTTNWTLDGSPGKYLDGDMVFFNDSATGSTNVILNTTVVPQSVTFANDSKDYTLSGSGSIGGTAPITKSSLGTLTLLNANTSTGITTVDGGTLQLGDGTTNGSIAGPLVNNDTVIFHPAGTSTHAGSLAGGGTFIKEGPGTQIITSSSNAASNIFNVNEGTLQFGNGSVNGAPGLTSFAVASGALLRFDQATATPLPSGGITGAGNVFLNSAQVVNGSADWGALSFAAEYTGVLHVEKGRVNANGSSTLGATTKVEILDGAQFLAFGSTEPYTTPIEIAGMGWGENGYPGGLRLAGNANATWAGSVTLTADSCIMAQRATNFTVSGPITGAFQCEFYSGDPVAENGNLIVAPTVPGQNTYASTKINGRPGGSVVAGSDLAFSPGPLVVDNAILKLDAHNLSFASLSGPGGIIGNYNATMPATLTVGSDNASTSYAGALRDGAAAPLALTKTGTGTLTLTTAQAYTGTTTVAQGKLALATASLADTAQVVINSGAVLELNTGAADIVGSLVINGTTVPTGTYNASHPTYSAYFSGTGSVVVGGAYDSWAASKGLSGADALPEADPDKDGILNLTEFYLDGNPLANDPAILPASSIDTNYLTLTFHRRDDAEASMASQAIQYGASLASWTDVAIPAATSTSPSGVIVTVVENDAASDTITVQIPRTLAAGGKLFGRLQVIK